jgi:MFS family permease
MTSVTPPQRPGRARRAYTVVVFVVLASLDNVAIGLVPPLYDPIGDALAVPEGAIAAVTAATYLITAVAAVGWAYAGDRFRRRPLLVVGTLLWAVGTFAASTRSLWPRSWGPSGWVPSGRSASRWSAT